MIKLDRHDLRLMVELDQSSNVTLSSLARKLRLGRDLVRYRLERLIDLGLISGFRAIIDPYRIGQVIYKTFLKLRSIPIEVSTLHRTINKHPAVYWSALSDGSYDIFFTCLARTPSEFWDLQSQILAPFSNIILEREFATNICITQYSRSYLIEHKRQSFYQGMKPINRELESLEYQIIHELAKNARYSVTELAKKLNSTTTQITHRINRLEHDQIIVGYKIDLNLNLIDRTFYKVRLFAPALTQGEEQQLSTFCRKIPELTYYVRQLGSCPIELSFEATSYNNLIDILSPLRTCFNQIIHRLEILLVREQSYKWIVTQS